MQTQHLVLLQRFTLWVSFCILEAKNGYLKVILVSSVEELIPVGIYLLIVNNINSRTRCEICSKLTIKATERHHWRCFGVFMVNLEHISYLLLTLSR